MGRSEFGFVCVGLLVQIALDLVDDDLKFIQRF